MNKRQDEIMKLQKLLFPILENKEIADRDKDLLRVVLLEITQESMSISKQSPDKAFAMIRITAA